MLINAFVPVAITTLEKRFQFSAFQMGVFVSSYDIAILIVQMPVCYFGEKGIVHSLFLNMQIYSIHTSV